MNDTIRRYPESIAVFNRLGVDSCCGGAASLADSAREAGVELDEMMSLLSVAVEASAGAGS